MEYFTTSKGLTSTSANYLANLAKEQIKQEQSLLNNLSYIDETVGLISSPQEKVLRIGSTNLDLSSTLKKISNYHAFIAWIREALKAKDELLGEVKGFGIDDYCKKFGKTLETLPLKSPVSEDDIIKEMNIKERNRYLTLEAFASTYGSYIHPDGAISRAREKALIKNQLPHDIQGEGRDALVYNYKVSVPIERLENMFNELQNEYREYEKQLNAIKYQIKEEVNRRNLAINQENSEILRQNNYNTELLYKELSTYVTQEGERISKLKIIIPEKLQDTYEYLESLGKKA